MVGNISNPNDKIGTATQGHFCHSPTPVHFAHVTMGYTNHANPGPSSLTSSHPSNRHDRELIVTCLCC